MTDKFSMRCPKYVIYFLNLSLLLSIKAGAAGCIKKNETVGLLEIHQTTEDGQCILFIQQNDPALIAKNKGTLKSVNDRSKRRYTFTQKGFLELYDPDKAQEIQFTQITTELNYSVNNREITVQLPSGQKMVFGESRGGEKGNIKSFHGFKSAREDSSGLNLIPNNSDTLLASSPVLGAFPHEKKKSPFDLMTSNGRISTLTSEQIFSKSATTYPTFNIKSLPSISNIKSEPQKTAKPLLIQAIKSELLAPSQFKKKSIPTIQIETKDSVKSSDDCKNFDQLLDGLNGDYLKIQGELTLSKLAYFYLKDSDQPTENLKLKIIRLLQESDLKDKQDLLGRKVAVNANLFRLKDRLQVTQKKWSTPETTSLLLNETDFQYFSMLAAVEKKTDQKKSVINFINMIDSSYRNSENSLQEKFLSLDKRFKILDQKKQTILSRIQTLAAKCNLEARSSCSSCSQTNATDNLAFLKAATEKADLKSEIEWGAFWLHTGKKGK